MPLPCNHEAQARPFAMAYDQGLAERVREVLADRVPFSERKMFGGLCFMVEGAMCCGLTQSDFMVRVGPAAYEDALAQPHARPMDFTGRPLRGMVYVAAEGLASDQGLTAWVERGLAFVRGGPASQATVAKPGRRRPAPR